MLNDANLHRDDFKLFAGFFTDGVFAAAASASQFMLGQLMNNFNTWQIGRQRLAFTTAFGRRNDFFVAGLIQGFGQAFRFVEERQLWCRRIACLLGLAPEQVLAQQRNFLFEMNDLALVGRALVDHLLKQLVEQNRIVRKVCGHGNHAADYTESGDVSRLQNLMRTVAPEVEAIEQPVQFLNGQYDGNVSRIG
ncbi:hypothetical protein D3C76_182210 [compost metagenome]